MGILGTVTVPNCKIRTIVILSTQNTKENITIDIQILHCHRPDSENKNDTKNTKRILQSKLQTSFVALRGLKVFNSALGG